MSSRKPLKCSNALHKAIELVIYTQFSNFVFSENRLADLQLIVTSIPFREAIAGKPYLF